MKKKYIFGLILIFFLMSGCIKTDETNNLIKYQMQISGKVIDSIFSHPLFEVLVSYNGFHVLTDQNGLYNLNIETNSIADVEIIFSKDSYNTKICKIQYDKKTKLDVKLEPKIDDANINGNIYILESQISESSSSTFARPYNSMKNIISFPSNFDNSLLNLSDQKEEYIVLINSENYEKIQEILDEKNIKYRYIPETEIFVLDDTTYVEIEILLSRFNVIIESNISEISLSITPTDPEYFRQWHFPLINLPQAWDQTTGDNDITIAVIDSGIALDHPDLIQCLVQGWDFVDNDDQPIDIYGHGTMVAGIIAAQMNNGIGGAGVAPNVKLMPLRAFDQFGVTKTEWILNAIHYAVEQGADVINMSFGMEGSTYSLYKGIKEAVDAGIIIIAAAGNDNTIVNYPAAYEEVIAVGAVDEWGLRAEYSNYGIQLDLMAPGGSKEQGVYSTALLDGDNSYGYINGTSFAASHVSGLVGLLLSSGLLKQEIYHNLCSSASDLNEPGKEDLTGYGLINAVAALNYQKTSNIKVFLGEIVNSTIIQKSYIEHTDENGDYVIDQVMSGDWNLIGWLDANTNEIIDDGDYFGLGPIISLNKNNKDYYPSFTGVNFAIYPFTGFESLNLKYLNFLEEVANKQNI